MKYVYWVRFLVVILSASTLTIASTQLHAANDSQVEQLLKTKKCPKCDLTYAALGRAKLRGADLAGAFLMGAYLVDADLRDADLDGADLSGANLSGARMSGARLCNTKMPDGHVEHSRC